MSLSLPVVCEALNDSHHLQHTPLQKKLSEESYFEIYVAYELMRLQNLAEIPKTFTYFILNNFEDLFQPIIP